MKLKNNLLLMLVVSVTLLLSISVAFAEEIDTNESISFDDTLSIETDANSQDSLSANGNVIYISPSGSGSGSSQDDPTNWNSALSKANSGDTIQFLNGTYNNIKGTIYQSIELKGSGNTTLDAQNNGGFITIGDRYSKSISVTLQDLSFINAYTGDKNGTPDGPKTGFDGEGAIVNGGNLIVKNCYFASNQGIGTEGGAIHNAGTCYVYDSTFFRNGGKKGGAIYADEGSSLYVYNSLFNKCVSREGCAVHAKEAYVEIHNTSVVNASAKNGLFYVKKSQIYFYDSYFYNSKAVDAAAVINIDKDSTVEIDNCIFDKLTAAGSKLWFHQENGTGNGGAIVVEKEGNTVTIKNSIFTNCNAKGEGGAIYIQSSSRVTIDNCTFLNNTAGEEGRHIYCYAPVSQVSITNSLFDVESTIRTSNISAGESENVAVTLDEGTTNVLTPDVSLIINGEKSSYNVGKSSSVSIPNLKEGSYTVELASSDNKNTNRYAYSQASSSFVVGNVKDDAKTDDNKTNPVKNESSDSKTDVGPVNNESAKNDTAPVNNGSSDGKTDVGPVNNESVKNDTAPVSNETSQNNTVGNETVYSLASQFNVTEGQSIETYAVDFPAGERGTTFQFQLTDSTGKPIANAPVQFAYKTVILNRTTDDNGIVFLGVSTQFADSYLCALSYLGDDTINATFVAFNFKLNKKPITIAAKAKTFKSSVKTKKYTITLKTDKCASKNGKTYLKSGKKVTLKINGKTYTAKINAKGQATFKITKLTKKGKYVASIKFAGDKTYNAASKKVKITIK